MSIKIILFPLTAIVCAYLIFAQIIPDVTQAIAVQSEIATKEQERADIEQKKAAIDRLASVVSSDDAQITQVLRAVPAEGFEEDVINDLNAIAARHQVSIVTMEFDHEENTNQRRRNRDTTGLTAQPRRVVIKTGIIGPYEGVKPFLREARLLERAGGLTEVEIEKVISRTEDGQDAATGNLEASIAISYVTMPSIAARSVGDLSHKAFSVGSSFDFTQFDAWRQQRVSNTTAIIRGPQGRGNPFLP